MSGASMTGTRDVLDPVEAARDDITRSKRLIASTLDDLTQHHSWLESYHREERRRVQRLAREDALRRLERKRQRAAFLLRRFAAATYATARATTLFLVRNGTAFAAWAAPRAYALSRVTLRFLSDVADRTWAETRMLARRGYGIAETIFVSTVHASDAAGVVFRRQVSVHAARLSTRIAVLAGPGVRRATIGWTRTRHRTRRLAFALETRLSGGWSKTRNGVSHWRAVEAPRLGRVLATVIEAGILRTRVQAENFSGTALKAGADGWSGAVSRARHILARDAAAKHRALIVRRSTALVCMEPRRSGLPAVHTV